MEKRYGFETDPNFDDQCGKFVKSEDTVIDGPSFDESSILEFSEVTPPQELTDLIHMESSFDLAPTPSISPFLLPSLFPLSFSSLH